VAAKLTQLVRGGARVGAQTLDEAVWLIPVVHAYDMVWDRMSPAQREDVARNVLRPSADVIRGHIMPVHNIQCWKNSAVGLVGLVLGDDALIRDAIDNPVRGFRAQIDKGITEDGLWYEGSLGYHAYTMSALWPLAVAASNAGINLFSQRYRSLYEAPIRLALPDGSAPGFNDSPGGTVQGLARLYELAYARWNVPMFGRLLRGVDRGGLEALLWGKDTLPSGPFLPTKSDILRSAGYAMMRTMPSRNRVDAVAVRYGMHGGGHGHPDMLNIVVFGAGDLLALDPGSIAYGAPLHREWYRTTIAHNTICVDEANQRDVDGTCEVWDVSGGKTKLVAAASEAAPGVQLRRSLTFSSRRPAVQSVLADRFEATCQTQHTYDWAFHGCGTLETDLKLVNLANGIAAQNGYQHIRSVRRAETDRPIRVSWRTRRARLTITMKGEPATVVFTGESPGRHPADKVAMIIVRRQAKSTTFDATMTIDRLR
jgi:hypothetical protein